MMESGVSLLSSPSSEQDSSNEEPRPWNHEPLHPMDETTPLTDHEYQSHSTLPISFSRRLYLSHFLSTWNSRVFEFGAVLYLASIYSDTLMPMSVYALCRAVSAVLLSPAIGRYIDIGERLHVVRISIVSQRLVVAASCLLFWLLATKHHLGRFLDVALFTILALLACIEKLASIMNTVSIERDWVVVIAGNDDSVLGALNSQMRRIDLFCKLVGPFAIAVVDGFSTKIAILVNLIMNIASVAIEYYAIERVYEKVPALKKPKPTEPQESSYSSPATKKTTLSRLKDTIETTTSQLHLYFTHPVFLPSIALSLLYLTVLSFSGQMTTYLLLSGYTSPQIATARTISVLFELSATSLAPLLTSRIGPIRSGAWFLSWQMLCLAVGASLFHSQIFRSRTLSAGALVIGTILSRIGLWGFDLSAQITIQDEVGPDQRGAFSSVESSFQNLFELLAYASTVVFADPEQFRWPVLISCAAVYCAGALYAKFVRTRRGHLTHFCDCVGVVKGKGREERDGLVGGGYQRLGRARDI